MPAAGRNSLCAVPTVADGDAAVVFVADGDDDVEFVVRAGRVVAGADAVAVDIASSPSLGAQQWLSASGHGLSE